MWTIWRSGQAKLSSERVLLEVWVIFPSGNLDLLLPDYFLHSFCGSTSEFCDTGCQSGFGGCGPPPRPSCGGSKVGQRTIGLVISGLMSIPIVADRAV